MSRKIALGLASLFIIGALAACNTGLIATVAPADMPTQSESGETAASQQPVTAAGEAASSQQPAVVTSAPASVTVPRTLSVSGTGTVQIAPDIAYINIGVHTENSDAAQALKDNNAQAQAVIDALTGAGVAQADIQTSNFNIYPNQQYDSNGVATGITYVVDNTVYVTVRDLNNLGALLDTVVKSGANSINGIEFDLADKTDAQRKAREQAIQNAKSLAEETAATAEVTLGQINSISVNTSSTPITYYDMMGRSGAALSASAAVPISTGQITVTADVSIVFEIQ